MPAAVSLFKMVVKPQISGNNDPAYLNHNRAEILLVSDDQLRFVESGDEAEVDFSERERDILIEAKKIYSSHEDGGLPRKFDNHRSGHVF